MIKKKKTRKCIQKTTQHYKAIILQLKIKTKGQKKDIPSITFSCQNNKLKVIAFLEELQRLGPQ